MSSNIPQRQAFRRKANPGDPPVQRPPQGPRGPMPGPHYIGAEGRIAIVHP